MKPEDMNTEENIIQQNYEPIPQYSMPQGDPNNYTPPQNISQNDTSNYPSPQNTLPQQNNNQVYEYTPKIENQNQYRTVEHIENRVEQANKTPNMYEGLSFITWFLFMSCKLNIFVKKMKLHSSILKLYYRPLLYDDIFIELITLIISSLGFFIYVKKIIYNKDEKLYNCLFGEYSKYHPLPLILYSVLKIIFESFDKYPQLTRISGFSPISEDDYKYMYDAFDLKAYYAFQLIFSLFSLCSLIFIYIKTEMRCEWYVNITIKKGIFSILIFESYFAFFESIFGLRYLDGMDNKGDIYNLYKLGGIFFCLLIAGFFISFSLYYKDIIIMFLNFLLFLGLTINFFGANGPSDEDKKLINGSTDGILEILITIASLGLICFMIIKYKEQLIEK